jgi:hypothetical protein
MGTPIHPSPYTSGLRGFTSELQKVVLRSGARRFSCRGHDGRSLRPEQFWISQRRPFGV